ncbi:MAG TPA: uroporphyrinogen decarboxylase family protein [Anaerolineae bacterium]|nr:uroporphyrinogen decarboxylase family protein [Anaerolineae bacterium]HQI84583.1 uroporphyrinogen decarboxylase family protein [Anaerolineae bacterium]
MPIIEPEFMELTQDLDVAAFWEENARCQRFTTDKPRCALSFSPDDHWIFEFENVPSTLRYYHDTAYRNALHKEVNAVTQEYVGRAFFNEDTWENEPHRIENLFDCVFTYYEGGTPWLTAVNQGDGPEDAAAFARILDKAEATDIRAWALPAPYLAEWEARKAAGKPLPKLGTGSRGPATIMTSVLKPETVFYWIYDYPDLMRHFRDILAEKMVEFNTVLREFSGNDEPGWWITDDNCALFNKKLYREYCFPVLKRVLEAMAPGDARRYQHSDSAMGHLLEMQYELGIRAVNYGPTVDAALIREKMPDAYIHGQLPPMLLRNGSSEEIRQHVISDFKKAGATGGLEIATAGSTPAGVGVGRMRWLMQVVQEECRY